jgi:hypothetical protein
MDEQQERRRTVFQRLYDSEINFVASCVWDGGFDVKLGGPAHGFEAEENGIKTWDEVCDWFEAAARIHYPNSHFTKGLL